ncbi:MAG: phasin family protein [Methylovirgula sp.]
MVERDRNTEDAAPSMAARGAQNVSPNISPNISRGAGDFPAAAENMRWLAGEIAEMSLTSLEQAKRLIEDVRDARHMDDLMAIQAKYMRALFETFAERSRRLGLFLAELPQEVTQASCDMVEASVEAAQDAAEVAANSIAVAAAASQTALREAR